MPTQVTDNESRALTVVEPGFVEGMSYADYAKVDALNGSKIVHMRRSAMKYRHELDNPSPPSPAMLLGTAIHRLILEPSLIGEFAIWGLADGQNVRRGKVWEQFQADNEGKFIVTKTECEAMIGTAVGARKNEPIRRYAGAAGPTEVSMFWEHPHTKRRFKARLDKLIPEKHTIFDLKSTRDCHSYKFGSQAFSLGYHIKMAIQWYGYKTLTGHEPDMKLGAIESKAPHESAVYRVTKDILLQGTEELDLLVEKLDECEKTGAWPPEQDEETDLVLPQWAMMDSFENYEEVL